MESAIFLDIAMPTMTNLTLREHNVLEIIMSFEIILFFSSLDIMYVLLAL